MLFYLQVFSFNLFVEKMNFHELSFYLCSIVDLTNIFFLKADYLKFVYSKDVARRMKFSNTDRVKMKKIKYKQI